jgi:exonuclease SbcC
VLALSIFLTRVMYQNISAFHTIFVDDPIQQMDDMNTAAFIDVVLGLSRLGRQIVLTTCNYSFYRLVKHKFNDACAESSISLKTIDLDDLST